ncbi:MAG TPA: hypothetical protein VN323_10200 [Candidatus Dormibacteraeota bacterium]|jgi:hypothetical protein|nr:hypothetical protein [Candidatus Dormibacteraeota bacterium]
MTRDKDEEGRLLAQVEAIFDRRGLTAEERESVVALLTDLLLKGLDAPPPAPEELDAWQRALVRKKDSPTQ